MQSVFQSLTFSWLAPCTLASFLADFGARLCRYAILLAYFQMLQD